MSTITGSIQYTFTGSAARLHSFPFTDPDATPDGVRFTPSTLNTALGGIEGGGSSSLLGWISGEGVAATYVPNVGWRGSLTEIRSNRGYWLSPYSGSSFNGSSASLSGNIRGIGEKYYLHAGQNLVSYPFMENRTWTQSIDDTTGNGTSLQDLGIKKIIGEGVAATFVSASDAWAGSLVSSGFSTGSGYWFLSEDSGYFDIWRQPIVTGSEWIPCPKGINYFGDNLNWSYGWYGKDCEHIATSDGWEATAYPPYSASGHTFGWREGAYNPKSIYWSGHIGRGPDGSYTSSLFDSASTDMTGSTTDGTCNFIVGFFKSASVSEPYPACCHAIAWHDHQESAVWGNEYPSSDNSTNDKFVMCKLEKHESGLTDGLAYPTNGDGLEIKVYDPRRNIVVTGSVHEVNINNGTASIGDEVSIVYPSGWGNHTTPLYLTHSANYTNEYIINSGGGGRCIKMKT